MTRSVEIPEEAVGAAAEMMWNLHAQEHSWDELMELGRDQMRSEAREVLGAALPYLAPAVPQPAEAREHAIEALHRERHFGRACGEDEPHQCLHYREAVRDVYVLAAADVLREGAVPQPVDREALRKLMRDALDAYVNLGPQGYWVYLDSIAAVLAGEQAES